jgi:hypothetical protein
VRSIQVVSTSQQQTGAKKMSAYQVAENAVKLIVDLDRKALENALRVIAADLAGEVLSPVENVFGEIDDHAAQVAAAKLLLSRKN